MTPSELLARFLMPSNWLSDSTIQTTIGALVFVGAVLMLIGLGTVAVYVWRNSQVKWLYKVGLEAVLLFAGIDLSVTAYETYHIVEIVNKTLVNKTFVNETPWDSKKTKALFQKVDKTSETVQATSLTVEALSQKIEELSLTVQEITRKPNDLNCPPEKTSCRHTTCRSDCASKASMTVPPSQSDSEPNHSAVSARQADGWVYVGTGSGLDWDEKYFNWDGEKDRLPEKGDILTATGSVHLRMPLGCQAPIVGAIAQGEQVHVLRAQTVSDCHHWVQVKRL